MYLLAEENILLFTFLTSFFVMLLTTPSLIKVAELKKLYDEPGEERKLHKIRIPSIGGIIIFAASMFGFALWFPDQEVGEFKYVIATVLILFFVGIKDDIIGTAPVKKLIAHFLVGLILVVMADIRLTSLHGLFGIREIPMWASIFLSLFTVIVVVNAFNLIDGLDGLAGGIGFISCLAFGLWFYFAGDVAMSCLAFALAGALLGFLRYNFYPAKIFMGDSGSLTIGLIVSILAIKLIEFDATKLPEKMTMISKPVFVMAVLVYPLFDTLRIFIYRSLKGTSPFAADKKHIHHYMLKAGLSQRQTVLILYVVNVLIILTSIFLKVVDPNVAFTIVLMITALLAQIPFWIKVKPIELDYQKEVKSGI